jgi:hypothetical protein
VIKSGVLRELRNLWENAAHGPGHSRERFRDDTTHILGVDLGDGGALKLWSSNRLDKLKQILPYLVTKPLCVGVVVVAGILK